MPVRPPTLRPRHLPSREESARAYDARRTAVKPWRRWYWTARWRAIAKGHLAAHPLCVMCEAKGIVAVATVCDHVEPHAGDPAKFWGGRRQGLCKWHHDRAKQREERGPRAG